MEFILSILVKNEPDALMRISNLFLRKGYTITNLSVGTTETDLKSRITIQTFGDENMKEQNSNENIHAQQNSSNTNIQTTSLNNEDNISKTQVNKLQPKVQNTTQKTKNATQSLNKTSTTPKATVPKPENKPKPKTDLEESTDYFFE